MASPCVHCCGHVYTLNVGGPSGTLPGTLLRTLPGTPCDEWAELTVIS